MVNKYFLIIIAIIVIAIIVLIARKHKDKITVGGKGKSNTKSKSKPKGKKATKSIKKTKIAKKKAEAKKEEDDSDDESDTDDIHERAEELYKAVHSSFVEDADMDAITALSNEIDNFIYIDLKQLYNNAIEKNLNPNNAITVKDYIEVLEKNNTD